MFMMIRVNKFFIEELQKAGYDIDFKTIKELYNKSKENPEYIKSRAKHSREHKLLLEAADSIYNTKE